MLVRVLTGRRAGKVVAVVGKELVVGSGRGCDLVLADRGVAERHAVLRTRAGGGYEVEDLDTPDGTFVAGRRIRGAVRLQGNEELCFGYTYAVLEPGHVRRRKARVPLPITLAAVAGIALVGTLIGVLLPRTGGSSEPGAPEPAAQVELVRGEGPLSAAPDNVPSRAPTPATEAPAAEGVASRPVVFFEDFSDATSGWEVFTNPGATAGYEQGEYVVRITELGLYATLDSGVTTESPVVSVTVRNVGGAPSAGFGVLCRYQDERNFLALAAGTDGTAAVLRQRDGTLSVISNDGQWVASPNVRVNASSYRLRADCRGRRVVLFVNGRQVVSARAKVEPGHVGLFAAGRVEFRFDDVTVVDGPA